MEVILTMRNGSDKYGSNKPKISVFRDVRSAGYSSNLYSIYMPNTTIRIPTDLIEEIREKRDVTSN